MIAGPNGSGKSTLTETFGWQIQNAILNLSSIVVEIDSGVMYNIGYENYT
jgi:predicted ABC-type ATPase